MTGNNVFIRTLTDIDVGRDPPPWLEIVQLTSSMNIRAARVCSPKAQRPQF